MPDLMIRDVPAEELSALASRAARHGRSRDDEVRHLIREAAAEELLLSDIERVSQAVDAQLTATAESVGTPRQPRRRGRRFEPTPRRG